MRDNAGNHHFAQHVVRDANRLADLDARIGGEHAVDFSRRDIGAPGFDDVGQPSFEKQSTFLVELNCVILGKSQSATRNSKRPRRGSKC